MYVAHPQHAVSPMQCPSTRVVVVVAIWQVGIFRHWPAPSSLDVGGSDCILLVKAWMEVPKLLHSPKQQIRKSHLFGIGLAQLNTGA